MADTGVFCSGADVLLKAGKNTSLSGSYLTYTDNFLAQAESFVNAATMYNWTANTSTLNAYAKGILKEVTGDLAAMYVINYDMSGYTSRAEAQTMLDVLRDRTNACLEILKSKPNAEFIAGI